MPKPTPTTEISNKKATAIAIKLEKKAKLLEDKINAAKGNAPTRHNIPTQSKSDHRNYIGEGGIDTTPKSGFSLFNFLKGLFAK